MLKNIFFILFFIFLVSCFNHSRTQQQIQEIKIDSITKSIDTLAFNIKIKKYDSILKAIPNLSLSDKARLMFDKANALIDTYKSKEALKVLEELIPIYKQLKNKESLGKVYINMGIVYGNLGKKAKQLEAINKGLNIAKEIGSARVESRAYSELAHLFYDSGDYNKSLNFLEKVLQIQKKEKDSVGMAATFQNMGLISAQKEDFSQAISYTLRALEIDQKINDIQGIAINYNNLGALYLNKNNETEKALEFFNKAIEIKKKYGLNINDEYHNIAHMYLKNKNFEKAEYYYWKAYENSPKNIDKKITVAALLQLAMQQKDIPKIRKYHQIEDSLLLLIEQAKAEDQIKLLEKNYNLNLEKIKLSIKNKKLQKNIYLYWFGVLILLFIGIISSLTYLNKSLKLQREKLLLEQKLLRAQLKPHFIFNSLAALQKTLIFESPMKTLTYLSKFAHLMRNNFEVINKGEILLSDEINLLKDYAEMHKIRMEKDFELIFEIDPEINPELISIPPLLLQPLIENSIEHGFANMEKQGKIIVRIFNKRNKICFEVIDNGSMLNLKPVSQKSDREHALDILKKRLKYFNKDTFTRFTMDSTENGTRVYFCIDYFENKK